MIQFEISCKDCISIFERAMIKLNSMGGAMEWMLMAVIAFVAGGLIGVKLRRERTDLRLRRSAREWEKGIDKK
ncbi:hypothetical protein EBAPG3_002040 [Nitrosospira lacus]|uniref:Uncharacterized protein n=1 Tax=Nitrosospira lacus TaxID=1288494 RepID=A0A1W6SLI5_9PROT|nr:hypothetical protein EBAPG3_002040 [Nitrosospira lacus]